MTAVFITGASRGLGLALARLFIKENENKVIGISRQQSMEHHNYRHLKLDLSDIDAVSNFQFPTEEFDKYILINNAGVIEPIAHLGHNDQQAIANNYTVNLIAPSLLTNRFIKQFSKKELHIINVSSGAGKYPIDGWSTYNASKAGLDMFSRVLKEELDIDGKTNIRIHSVAPGIVNTDMQGIIRSSNKKDFSNIERFKSYFDEGELVSGEEVAKKYKFIVDNPDNFPEVVISVRDF